MNNTGVQIIKMLLKGDRDRAELEAVGVKRRQVGNVLADLEKRGYAVRKGARRAGLPETPKTTLLRDIAAVADIGVFLRGSNEEVLAASASGATAEQISERTGRSLSTVHRAAADLLAAGALRRDGDAFTAEGARRPFSEMARMLQLERSSKYSQGAEILYSGGSTVIRRVAAGAECPGHLTGLAAFSSHGVEYRTVHDCYCERRDPPDVLDVLLHAILESKSGGRSAMSMCVIFYLKHRDGIDTVEARRRARRLGVGGEWLDVESYVRGRAPRNGSSFLPWKEFLAKAWMYGLAPQDCELPRPDDSLFEALGGAVESPVTAYLIGGENMRRKGLKDSTKDCDIVVETDGEAGALAGALRRIGYSESGQAGDDERIRPEHVFEHPSRSRVDLFNGTVCGKMGLTGAMKRGAEMSGHGALRIGLLADEHVFLLKAVTGREGDVDDMAVLSSGPGQGRFDWNAVFDGIAEQVREDSTREQFAAAVLYSVLYMCEAIGSKAPILGRLKRLAADAEIKRLLRGGSRTVGEAVSMLKQDGMGEALIRNRINALAGAGLVRKRREGRTARVVLADEAYPHGARAMAARSLEEYLRWRFCALQIPAGADLDSMAEEMEGSGFSTIGVLDGAVRQSMAALDARGQRAGRLDARGAVRACVEMSGARSAP